MLLENGDGGRARRRAGCEIEPVETIDATRRFARVRADGRRAAARRRRRRARPDRRRRSAAELVGVAQRAMEMAVEYARDRKQFDRPIGAYQAVVAPLRADAARDRERPLGHPLRGLGRRRRARDAAAGRLDGQGLGLGRRLERDRLGAPGARRHRLHLGARPALLPQARQGRTARCSARRARTASAWPSCSGLRGRRAGLAASQPAAHELGDAGDRWRTSSKPRARAPHDLSRSNMRVPLRRRRSTRRCGAAPSGRGRW